MTAKEQIVRDGRFIILWDEAIQAGHDAVRNMKPITPMVVQEHTNPLDDNSPVKNEWIVPDGPCGFAWVNIKSGNTAFAKWLVRTERARKDSYYGGVTYWVHDFNQSYIKKQTFAYAMAQVLSKSSAWTNIRAHGMSRMD